MSPADGLPIVPFLSAAAWEAWLEFFLIGVADTGGGIGSSDLAHVFDRFWKSADSGGSGLGLAIARGLIEAHGGQIRADSVPGKGTVLSFTLPLI